SNKGDLDVTDDLIVNGDGAAVTIIHGGGNGLVNPSDRIFHVPGNANLTLNDLTLRNGAPPTNESGGAILVQGTGNLTVTSCIITQNVLDGTLAGGGIADDAGAAATPPLLTISKSQITDNSADLGVGGGVIASNASISISESTISE